jgi:hypothetical protein
MVMSSEGLDPRVAANCTSRLLTRSLVRDGARHQETLNCQTEKKNIFPPLDLPPYLQSVPLHSANVVKSYTKAC